MSAITRLHRPNPINKKPRRIYHPCSFCLHGGGTLKKTDDPTKPFVHTEARFCEKWWTPKSVKLQAQRIRDAVQARIRRQTRQQAVAFQRKSV